ncbi:AT-rich interactive domain-containing protein 3A-like isoform X2 [Xyrauchen texanus]|uniref:AT-rich interactive domain-containing protein 3A-like isoform X2 n=1 Tax=Xyrauchen texanus TaxID=154827 RepID=UPI0022429DF0|nr:AT-rich interactive domain-containing protein 3A-like isoform X2 [Xyrauchen texanus]
MVDNTSIATKSALQAAFSSVNTLPVLVNSSSAHSQSSGGGGMKLEAVMENLQRQQAARLALEEKLRQAEKEKDIRSMVESQIQQQALAFRHYQAAVRGVLEGGAHKFPMASLGHPGEHTVHSDIDDDDDDDPDLDRGIDDEDRDLEEDDSMNECGGDEDLEGPLAHYPPRHAIYTGAGQSPKSTHTHLSRVQPSYAAPRQAESPSGLASQAQSQHHEWTYEEQFKQLYELDDDEKRKEFLDDLFSFMQKRGTPVNRIPIMAKQVLDLYTLYKLVTEKGGLVEVINKKIWREITKGLNLPTSITSAAFTLRTQYMKYLYPYECEKRGLSSPGELQAAIDSNRREGRRQSYGSTLFNYSPVGTPTLLASPKLQMPHISMPTLNGGHMTQSPVIKKEDTMLSNCLTNRVGIPVSFAGHHSATQAAAAQAAAAAAVQAAALEQLREKLESGEPPEKKVILMAEEQQRIMQHALQQNLFAMATQLPMNIKLNSRDDRQETALNLSTNGISSINMSIEINGVVYTGVLFARKPTIGFMTGNQRIHHQHSSQVKSSSPGLSNHMPLSSSSSSSTASSHGPATSP